MTDRTRALAEQAFEFAYRTCKDIDHTVGANDSIFFSIVMGKYTELVAEECASLCDRFQARDVGMQPAECAGAIRQMFGVKA